LQEFLVCLALPILAVLKVIFDRVESLEPWGYLMGDHLPKHILGATLSYRCLILNQHQKIVIKTDIVVPVFTETTTENDTTRTNE
jgi:hypothetical protein